MSDPINHDDLLDRALEAAARAVSGPDGEAMTEHPDSEMLVAYQEQRLTDEAAKQVRWHLAVCEECARDVLALADVELDQADPEVLPSVSETTDEWETFKNRLAREAPVPGVGHGDGPRRDPPSRESGSESSSVPWRVPHFLALAASVVIALGLGYWIFREPADTSNPFLADLLPDGAMPIRDASRDQDVTVPDGMSSLILRLNLGDQTPYDSYRVEIHDTAGKVRWEHEGLQRQPAGQFIVWVQRADIPAGSYELRLFGVEGDGTKNILATYSFRLYYATE